MTATAAPAIGGSSVPDWLQEHRALQGSHFQRHGLPTQRLENWKYTSLRALEGRAFEPLDAEQVPALASEDLAFCSVPVEAWRLVFVDGIYQPRLSFIDGLPAGVALVPLSAADDDRLQFFQRQLLADYDRPDQALAALAASAATDGMTLVVEAGVTMPRPIHLLYLSVESDKPRMANLRTLVELGPNASLSVIEHHASLGKATSLVNLLTQVRLGVGSQLHQIRLQQGSDSGYLVTRQEVEQLQDSRFDYFGFDLGGRLVRHDLDVRLIGTGAHAGLNGLYALAGRRHVDNHTRVDHVAPNTTSDEFFKGVLDGGSRAVFNGKVVVHPGADKTDASQTNRNLLLSPHAEIDTKPELEIYADDVKCAHGATVGQLDERQLFYLRSRGIDETEARLLLTYAFCREVVERVGSEEIATWLTEQVVANLPRREALEDIAR